MIISFYADLSTYLQYHYYYWSVFPFTVTTLWRVLRWLSWFGELPAMKTIHCRCLAKHCGIRQVYTHPLPENALQLFSWIFIKSRCNTSRKWIHSRFRNRTLLSPTQFYGGLIAFCGIWETNDSTFVRRECGERLCKKGGWWLVGTL